MSAAKKKSVYILCETYKENDPDTIGVFDSKRALAQGFCDHIASDILSGTKESDAPGQVKELMYDFAKAIARLLPRLFDPNFDGTDECRCGNTVWSYKEMPLSSVEDDEEEEES